MPIFMDLHITPGASPKDVALAHILDFEKQDQYGCRAITYWYDEVTGTGFCLFEAPAKESVIELHKHTHGLTPNEIIPVDSHVVEAFLGRLKDPDGYFDADNPDLKIFNDPAFRIIMVTETEDERLLKHTLGENKTNELLKIHNHIIREKTEQHQGREAELENDGFVISFVSVTGAVECAVDILQSLHVAADLLNLRIGIHAGLPVNQSKRLFGKTISFAGFLCKIARGEKIILSSVVRKLYKPVINKQIHNQQIVRWITPAEENFLEKLLNNLEENWNESEFGVMDLCNEMSVSKPQLYRKCKHVTGMSPNELLREFRLTKSLELLKNDNRNISQTTFEAGFNSPSYFTKCFQKRFEVQPLTYQKELA